jgi:large subunit ribosomal protein L19
MKRRRRRVCLRQHTNTHLYTSQQPTTTINHQKVDDLKKAQLRTDLPDIHIGDTVRVGLVVQEAKSARVQRVEGTVIAMAGSGSGRTMVVRRIFQGVGVEMSVMVHSPVLSSVEVVRRGKVRRCAAAHLLALGHLGLFFFAGRFTCLATTTLALELLPCFATL